MLKKYFEAVNDSQGIEEITPVKESIIKLKEGLSKIQRVGIATKIYKSLYEKLLQGKETKSLGTVHEDIIANYFTFKGEELKNTNIVGSGIKYITPFFDLVNASRTSFISVKLNHAGKTGGKQTWSSWIEGNFKGSKKWLLDNTIGNKYFNKIGVTEKEAEKKEFYICRGFFVNEENSIKFIIELSNSLTGLQIKKLCNKYDDNATLPSIVKSIWAPQYTSIFSLDTLENSGIMQVKDRIKSEIIAKTFSSAKPFVKKIRDIADKAEQELS